MFTSAVIQMDFDSSVIQTKTFYLHFPQIFNFALVLIEYVSLKSWKYDIIC